MTQLLPQPPGASPRPARDRCPLSDPAAAADSGSPSVAPIGVAAVDVTEVAGEPPINAEFHVMLAAERKRYLLDYLQLNAELGPEIVARELESVRALNEVLLDAQNRALELRRRNRDQVAEQLNRGLLSRNEAESLLDEIERTSRAIVERARRAAAQVLEAQSALLQRTLDTPEVMGWEVR